MRIFMAVCEMAERLGVSDIKSLPGCWEHQVDERWWVAVNAHKKPVVVERGDAIPVTVPPFTLYVEYNGWPAGVIRPSAEGESGEFAAGTGANPDAFIAACLRVHK